MSNLIDQASLVMIPSGYKEDKIYSQVPTDGSGDLTFTRSSDGTRVNSQGLVERVPWNLLQQSNSFSTSPWYDSGTSETGGQAGYDGTNDAWKLTRGGAFNYFAQNITTSGVQTFSVYAKADTFNWLLLRFQRSSTSYAGYYFDLANGVVGSADGSGVIDASITSVGGGWNRISITFNETLLRILFYPVPSNGGIGSSGSGSVIVQDAQLNEGSTAKPYFPTTDRLNVPRLDYTNGCPSLLLEPQRTNVFTYSESFDNAAWTKQDATITANAAISPDGTQNADLYTSSSDLYDFVRQTISFTSGTTYTYSVFAKAGTSSLISLGYSNVAFSSGPSVEFDLSDGTYVIASGSPLVQMENYGNGWYRCCITDTATASVSRSTGFSSAASGAVTTLYLWGAQLEAGSYPTSYIPTTSAAVTRVADTASKTGLSSVFNDSEGVFFAEMSSFDDTATKVITISDGTTSNRVQLYYFNGDTIRGAVAGQAVISHIITITENIKVAFKYKVNDFALWVNGVQVGTDSFGSTPSGLNKISFDNGASSSLFEGNIKQLIYFPTALTNAELAALTTL